MSKKLTIGNIKHYAEDVLFNITEQTHRQYEFGFLGNIFLPSNGITLCSGTFPQVIPQPGGLVFYVRGADSTYDNVWLCTSQKHFGKIQKAIEEYNEVFSGQMNLSKKDIECLQKMDCKRRYTTENGTTIKTVPDKQTTSSLNCEVCILYGKPGCRIASNSGYPSMCSIYKFHYEKA